MIPWNKGRKDIYSEETLKKMSEAKKKGFVPWNKGMKGFLSEEALSRRSEKMRGRFAGNRNPAKRPEVRAKISESAKGRILTVEHRKKISESRKGEKNTFWRGGISKEPYTFNFNEELKNKVKERDNNTCQGCGTHVDNLFRALHIHHIDYDKKNDKISNLITLCEQCHAKTNFNRKWWISYFNSPNRHPILVHKKRLVVSNKKFEPIKLWPCKCGCGEEVVSKKYHKYFDNFPLYIRGHHTRHMTETTKLKMSQSRTGERHPFFGKHHSEETKKKMQSKGRVCRKETFKIRQGKFEFANERRLSQVGA